jgi:hypothetical protein
MAMGQAAGSAATMASAGGSAGAVRAVPFDTLRARLVADGAILELVLAPAR